MVKFDNLNFSNLLISFRKLAPFQQAVIVGTIFFLIYWLYGILLLGMEPIAAASESIYSALLFLVVYYFTMTVILRKNLQSGAQVKGPKKGLRNK